MAGDKKFNAWLPNFGAKGWGITMVCFMFYFFYAFWNGGTNTLFPIFTEQHGWQTTDMSFVVTVGGWVSLIGIVAFGALLRKAGAKIVCAIGLFGSAVAFVLLAVMDSFAMYVAALILFYVSMVAYGTVGVGALGSNWFPRTKGAFMGIATIGMTLSTALCNPLILAFDSSPWGVSGFFVLGAVVLVALAVITLVFVKNNPEEAGAYPDNDKSLTREELDREFAAVREYKKNSPWTTARVLKTPQTWLIAIGLGIVGLVASGLMALLVPVLMAFGHDELFGVTLLSTMWPVGLLGHYLIGVLDYKLGSKKTTMVVICVLALAGLFVFVGGENGVVCAVGTAMLMFAMSGGANMIMSLTTSIFGREDFETAYPVVQVIYSVLGFTGISVMALVMETFGGAYVMLAAFILSVVALVPIALIPYKQIASRTQSGADAVAQD